MTATPPNDAVGAADGAARWIRLWLIVLGFMVYAMILIGGMTRLTDSGLSITEWEPIKGALLPMGAEGWGAAFEKYKQTAEYRLVNAGMSLDEFKYIYFWEWGHRLFGRLIGLVAVGGLVWFAVKRWMNGALARRLVLLVALGGLQGAIGWWMVASGIGETTRVDVAPYRLMTHFMLALVIIAYTGWLWLSLGTAPSVSKAPFDPNAGASGPLPPQAGAEKAAILLLILVMLQMAAGALVAGLDAGRTYTDWPLMAGEWVPRHYIVDSLGIRSLFEGREATQFNHRLLAYVLWTVALVAAWRFRAGLMGRSFAILAALVSVQAVWGILTLMNAAPLQLALVHQGLGVIVTLASVRLVWLSRYSAPSVSTDGSTKTA